MEKMTEEQFRIKFWENSESLRKYSLSLVSKRMGYEERGEKARDLVNNCFEKALKHLDSFRGEGSFQGWLTLILRNCFFDELTRQKTQKRGGNYTFVSDIIEDRDDKKITHSRLVDHRTPEDDLKLADLVSCIETISPKYLRTILIRHGVLGESYKDIAKSLGISEVLARKRMQEAREYLKQLTKNGTMKSTQFHHLDLATTIEHLKTLADYTPINEPRKINLVAENTN